MTPVEILWAYNGYRKKMQEPWEMVRELIYYSVAPHTGKKGKSWTRKSIILPFDKPRRKEEIKLTKVTMLDA